MILAHWQGTPAIVAETVHVSSTLERIAHDTTSAFQPIATAATGLARFPLIRISLVLLAIGFIVSSVIAARRMRGGQDLMSWLRDFPWTPFRIMLGIGLATTYVIFLCSAMVLGVALDLSIVIAVGSFILLQEGLDISQYGIQRKTFNAEASAADAAERAARVPAPVVTPVSLPPITPTPIPGGERGE